MTMFLKWVKSEKSLTLAKTLLFLSGLLIFICLFQLRFPWSGFSVLGILLSGFAITRDIKYYKDFFTLFDIDRFREYFSYFIVISILIGLFWGLVFRHYLNIQIIPGKLGYFTFTAMAIGTVEELIFRGYVQRQLRNLGIIVSILGASLIHSLYKCLIFIVLPTIHPTDFFNLFIWTFGVGCLSGILKELSANTMVPVSGHAVFDLVVYGDGIVDRWWVWL